MQSLLYIRPVHSPGCPGCPGCLGFAAVFQKAERANVSTGLGARSGTRSSKKQRGPTSDASGSRAEVIMIICLAGLSAGHCHTGATGGVAVAWRWIR